MNINDKENILELKVKKIEQEVAKLNGFKIFSKILTLEQMIIDTNKKLDKLYSGVASKFTSIENRMNIKMNVPTISIDSEIRDEITNLKEVIKDICTGLYNPITQNSALKDMCDSFMIDNEPDDMDEEINNKDNLELEEEELDILPEQTSKWGNTFTTRQGDNSEERLEKLEKKITKMSSMFSITE